MIRFGNFAISANCLPMLCTTFLCPPRASILHFLCSRAAHPHQQPTTSGKSPNNKHDLCVFLDTARSLVHFSTSHLPLCAYSMLHLASTSISSCLQAQRARNRRRALANRSQSRQSTPGLSPLSLREYLLQPLTISNCSLMLHAIYTHLVCLVAQPLPILLLC